MKSLPFPSSRLARDITLTIAVKLLLVACLKFAFFSEPMDKAEAAQRIAARVSGFSAPAGDATPLSSHPHPEKP